MKKLLLIAVQQMPIDTIIAIIIIYAIWISWGFFGGGKTQMKKFLIIILFISVVFPQLSIKDKQIYDNKINKYYSADEFIKSLNSDTNFVDDKNFINYKKYVNAYLVIPIPKFYRMYPTLEL